MEFSPNKRAEAQYWIGIAEKLLISGDFTAAKAFALRAKQYDPTILTVDHVIAVSDTLIAGEKLITNDQQPDYYSILQLVPLTHDSELIATQFRRLAPLLSPQNNKLAFAEQAFKLVVDAWSVFSNPAKKFAYDNEFKLVSNLVGSEFAPSQQTHESLNQNQSRPSRESVIHGPQLVQKQPHEPENQNPGSGSGCGLGSVPELNSSNSMKQQVKQNPLSTLNKNFWTACPYCYHMYEYAKTYADCTLRCQKCECAFQAVVVSSPPTKIVDGKEGYFCCWGFFPVGFSGMSNLEKKNKVVSGWTPFSSMFTFPQVGEQKKMNVGKISAPRIYVDDDDDVFVEESDLSEGSDVEWGSSSTKRKRKASGDKGKGTPSRNVKNAQVEKGKNVGGGSGENSEGGGVMQEGVRGPNVVMAESSKKVAASNEKKQPGKAGKDLGKLDLNIVFGNVTEERAPRISERHGAGNGEEENIGIGFFEGLDEFLSSLPM